MRFLASCILLLASLLSGLVCSAAALKIPPAAQPSQHFHVQAATDAWIATVDQAARARSDGYFEGGYWLQLWDFLWTSAILWIILATKASARLRDWLIQRCSRAWLRTILYWLVFATLVAVLSFPLTVYEGFFREHQYGLSNQSFTGWFRDAFLGFLIGVIFTAPLIALLYWFVRRFPASWHIWGTVFVTAFTIVSVAVAPVFIMPLFNQYKPLPDSRLKAQILSLAHANQIPVQNVYESDASRQSRRVSANVSGLGGTDRITLNDNLLQRCSPEGVLSVMGHEMGHYVMHHVWNGVLFSALLTLILFSFLRWSLDASIRKWGARWGIQDSADIAGLPLALLLLLTSGFVLTPVINTYTRTQEFEADIFGLNAARQPDGEAEVDLLLGEYRKLDPSPLEEFIFFDHPSGRRRIEAAMKWKAENLCLFDAALTCENHALASGPR